MEREQKLDLGLFTSAIDETSTEKKFCRKVKY